MTAQTPIYGLKYIVQGEPIRAARQALEDNAKTIETALQARGVAAPGAADLLTVSGRVSTLEALEAGGWVDVPFTSALTGLSVSSTTAGATPPKVQYRVEARRVYLRGWAQSVPGYAVNVALLSTALPLAARPAYAYGLYPHNDTRPNAGLHRHEIGPNGQLYAVVAVAAGTYLNFDGLSYPLG